ncbi:MAG TPA: cytochrome c family protein [Bacteroidota bacterium]|nr:cytochrome c family protein [Bacteroidota bacterium]
MRTLIAVLVLGLVTLFLSGNVSAENKYVGVKKCAMCHKAANLGAQYSVWEKSAHAKAFETLKSQAANDIAKKKGLKTAAAESPECLKCHVTGGGTAPGVVKEEGVTCEACHGAAEKYLMVHNKKDDASKATAKADGFVMDAQGGKTCEVCHNSQSPNFKGFKFAEAWAKIEHKMPKK